jgi:hypothetical protein
MKPTSFCFLPDEVIDALSFTYVTLGIDVSNVANVRCAAPFRPWVSITNGELFDAVLDANGEDNYFLLYMKH